MGQQQVVLMIVEGLPATRPRFFMLATFRNLSTPALFYAWWFSQPFCACFARLAATLAGVLPAVTPALPAWWFSQPFRNLSTPAWLLRLPVACRLLRRLGGLALGHFALFHLCLFYFGWYHFCLFHLCLFHFGRGHLGWFHGAYSVVCGVGILARVGRLVKFSPQAYYACMFTHPMGGAVALVDLVALGRRAVPDATAGAFLRSAAYQHTAAYLESLGLSEHEIVKRAMPHRGSPAAISVHPLLALEFLRWADYGVYVSYIMAGVPRDTSQTTH